MSRPGLIPIILISFILHSHGFAQTDSEIDWYEEIDLIETELVKRHPDLFFSSDSATFYASMDRVVEESRGKSLFEVAVMLQQVVASLGDAHTMLNYHYLIDKQKILPLECYWFEDGLYIIRAREEYEALLGKKISGVNHFPLSQVVDSLSTLISGQSPSIVRNAIPRMITWTQLLGHFTFADNSSVSLQLENSKGNTETVHIELPSRESSMKAVNQDDLPLGWMDKKVFFRELYLPGEKIYYLQYNKCWSREAEEQFGSGASALFMPLFREFEKTVLTTIRKEKVDKLVLDMRFNGGGSSLQGTRFINKLARTHIGDGAGIFLVVGRATFSSAIINSVDLMQTFPVVVVGENSGGPPNHFGEVERFVLPRTNLVISCSTKFFKLVELDLPSIQPDILTPISFGEFMQGIDPALEAVRAYQAD